MEGPSLSPDYYMSREVMLYNSQMCLLEKSNNSCMKLL